jgi:D-3-phosphoglycerate dehydrogenase
MDILISEELDSPAIQKLSAKYKVVRQGGLWKNPAELKTAIAGARAIMVRNQTQLTAEILAAAPQLLAIGRVGVGLDNIDLPAASKSGVVVIAPLDANAVSVAELTMTFALALARKIPQADRSTKAGGWDRKGCTGIELDGKTFAICGFGRIGRRVAVLARAFGMKSLVFDPFVKSDSPALTETGASWVATLEEALAAADFITTHSPLTPETRHMFNTRTFALTKRGAFFINTSRGGVVDETALQEALRSGQLGGAALDVREKEPPGEKKGLEQMDNVILAPHIGAFTAESQTRTFEAVAGDVDRILSGQPALNFVNMARPTRSVGA